ncbi:GNAT family N-acetyltransferase [Candidatus Bathyarchaeota archaeon]|nr:GNAT family N-acetyltransferase [Candidatus Bathyarchaeota archaeon]
MRIRIEEVSQTNFSDIPDPCRYCLYWQTTGAYSEEHLKPYNEREKKIWLSRVAREFGECAKIAYLEDSPAGFVQFAPAKFFPRTAEYSSGLPSKDAVFVACLYVAKKEARGKGLGTAMLEDLIGEVGRRGFKALETFARKSSAENPSGSLSLYLKYGFKVVVDKDDFPLVRLER